MKKLTDEDGDIYGEIPLYEEVQYTCRKCGFVGSIAENPASLVVAARQLGQPVSKIRRAAKFGAFPTFTLQDRRVLVFVSDIRAAILDSRKDGAQ